MLTPSYSYAMGVTTPTIVGMGGPASHTVGPRRGPLGTNAAAAPQCLDYGRLSVHPRYTAAAAGRPTARALHEAQRAMLLISPTASFCDQQPQQQQQVGDYYYPVATTTTQNPGRGQQTRHSSSSTSATSSATSTAEASIVDRTVSTNTTTTTSSGGGGRGPSPVVLPPGYGPYRGGGGTQGSGGEARNSRSGSENSHKEPPVENRKKLEGEDGGCSRDKDGDRDREGGGNEEEGVSVGELKERVEILTAQLHTSRVIATAACAAHDQIRKTSQIDISNAKNAATTRVLKSVVLDLYDDLNAITQFPTSQQNSANVSTKEGEVVTPPNSQVTTTPANQNNACTEAVSIVKRDLLTRLKNIGVDKIEIQPGTTKFDPSLHEAFSVTPTAETSPGKVMNVARDGFTLNNTVLLRPALVTISATTEQKKP
ncbi:hypothetical protein Pelo_18601 [Pelomyxa schiedti]|nr:hypothetical protein Pelo_18601 [Pelomyxa schiedti]